MINLLKWVKCVLIAIISSNINEVIRIILNFFIQKLHTTKKQNAYKRIKIKNVHKNHLSININEVIKSSTVDEGAR